MQSIGAFHAKTHFSALLDQVEKGEEIIITKHGHPVARLIPMMPSRERVKQAVQHLKEFGRSNKLEGLDWKELRDKGRR